MTQAEFYAAQRKAQERFRKLYNKINRGLSELYKTAANQIAKEIRRLEINRRGTGLTAVSLRKLESALRKIGAYIAGEAERMIINGIDDTVNITNYPHLKYLKDGFKNSKKIDFDIIEKIYSQLNTTLIEITYTRLWTDGYTFVERIWKGIPANFQQAVKSLVSLGITQGRDILQVAKDLTYYAAHGKEDLMKRYGDLVRGTAKFKKRIPKYINYKAMKIARSELYISLQDAAKFQGRLNPAVMWYVWNLTGGRGEHPCDCPDLAANSPYPELEVPDYPHPNCLCYITHKIIGRDEFVQDLITWDQGIGVPYLDNWYINVYQNVA
jgi:hypothetical protein